MTPRGRLNLVMGLLVAGGLAFGFWRWQQQVQAAAAVSAQIAAHAAQSRISNQEKNRVGTARAERGAPGQQSDDSSPLPAWGEPLGANFQAVLRRADAGQARAACRIGVELSLCRQSFASGPDGAPAQSLTGYCQGVDETLSGQTAVYLRKAALAGNTDAMLRYASAPFPAHPGDAATSNDYLHDPAFGDWYAEALPMVQRALHAGDAAAVPLLARAYADDRGLFDARVPNDPVLADAYALLLSYLQGGAPPAATRADPRQHAQAQAQAQRMFRESFGSQPAKGGVVTDLTLDRQIGHGQRAPCQ